MKFLLPVSSLLVLVLIAHPGTLCGQEEADCKQLIKEVYQSIAHQFSQVGAGVFYLDYTTKILLPGEEEWTITNVKVYSNQQRSYLISSEIEVYEDQQTTISVIPANQLIYIQNSGQPTNKTSRLKQLASFQDSLLRYSNVQSCQALSGNRKEVVLKLNEAGKKIFQAEAAIFILDLKNKSLVQAEIQYLPSYRVRRMVLVFNKVQKNYPTQLFAAPLMNRVFEPDGKLKERYRGYQIYDSRKSQP